MQKIFIRFFIMIMAATVSLALVFNFCLQTVFSERRAVENAAGLMNEVKRRFADNQLVIDSLLENLSDNYITRARALAEIIAQNPSVLDSLDEMNRLAAVLHVDEVHVIDQNGLLMWGNVPSYYNLDFTATDQTRPFLAGLTDKNFALAQEPRPNGSEGKLFQYIGVARQDQPGVVQVGVVPEILDDALANNKVDAVIANYNVPDGVYLVALDPATGLVVADSGKHRIGDSYTQLAIAEESVRLVKKSGWITRDGERLFAVYGQVDDYLLEVTYTKPYMFTERKNQNIAAAVSSILLGAAIIAAIFILLKKMIIGDIELANQALGRITAGNLDVVVDVHSTPEFVTLSSGINQMVGSLRQQMDEIVTQAESIREQAQELEERNRNILSSLNYARKIQNNLLPSKRAFDLTFSDYSILWEPKDVVGGDIYWIKSFPAGSVLCVCDCTGHGTPGALLTMLVITALDAIVDEPICSDTAGILWELEQRLVSTLNVAETEKDSFSINDGADLAILFISRAGDITLSSAKLHIFVCDGNTVENIKGQKLSIGDGSLKSREQIKTLSIPGRAGQSCYIVSDGLFEQIGGEGHIPFGYTRFKQIILQNHGKSETEIADSIWSEFKAYMGGENRRDDVTMIGFRLPQEEDR